MRVRKGARGGPLPPPPSPLAGIDGPKKRMFLDFIEKNGMFLGQILPSLGKKLMDFHVKNSQIIANSFKNNLVI